jgi:hypothetical protein
MFVLSSSTGWIDHALGLGSVLEMRGPHAFVAGTRASTSGHNSNSNSNSNNLAHTLLESSRFLIILASLAVSKRTFLSRDEWKTIPWSRTKSNDKILHPGEAEAEAEASKSKRKRKSPANMLLDIFADLPGLKEQRERERERGRQRGGRGTRRHDEDSRPCDDDLRAKASNIINDLLSWRRMWDSSPEGQITTKDLSAVDAVLSSRGASLPRASLPRAAASPPSSHFKFFDSTVLTFTSTHAATYTCLYDAALIMAIELFLTNTTPGIDQAFPPPPPPPPSAPPPPLSSASLLSAGPFERSDVDDGDGDEEDHRDDDVVADEEDARMLSLSRTAAVEICRSIPFQLSRTSSLTGQFLVLYPLRMAWKALGGSRWVQDLLDDFGRDPRNRWGVLRQTLTSWHQQ